MKDKILLGHGSGGTMSHKLIKDIFVKYFSNPILNQLLQSMLYAAESRDYYLLSFPFFDDQEHHIETYGMLYDTQRVDGFIILSTSALIKWLVCGVAGSVSTT